MSRLMPMRPLIAAASLLALAAPAARAASRPPEDLLVVNRLSWGADAGTLDEVRQIGISHWIDRQLHWQGDTPLPEAAQAEIASMRISREPMAELVVEEDRAQPRRQHRLPIRTRRRRRAQAYQQAMNDLAREARNARCCATSIRPTSCGSR